jgi:hypothetical protein
MRYLALLRRAKLLESKLSVEGLKVQIRGGLPSATDKSQSPPGADLHVQHREFTHGKADNLTTDAHLASSPVEITPLRKSDQQAS